MKDEDIVNDVIKRIEKMLDYKNNISVSDVGEISGYSIRYIQKKFKKITGINISSYIKKRRLTQAAILLKLTKKKIHHIAMDLDFSTQQSFTRAFVREFKVTPLAYRNEIGFDCSRLFFGITKNPHINTISKKTLIKSFKLKAKEFRYRDGLLGGAYSRPNNIRVKETTSILSEKDEAIIVTTLYPSSSLEFEIDLVAMIGYSDTVYYNYETKDNYCWEIEYNGTWDEYILFGRVFLFYFDIKFNLTIIERIRRNGINEDGKELFIIKIYLPIP